MILAKKALIMKRIAGGIGIALLIIVAAASAGCTRDVLSADAKALAGRDNRASAPVHATLVIPTGTSFGAVLQTRLSTDANSTGDPFVATTIEPIVVDGRTVVPARSRIDGVLRDVQSSGRIKDHARMTLVFQEIADSEGRTHAISAFHLTIQAASETRSDAQKTAAGGAGSAISGKRNGAVIGAASGAGAGTIFVLATKGHDVVLSQGVKLYVRMTGPTSFEVATRK
jgi:hypothetical protein